MSNDNDFTPHADATDGADATEATDEMAFATADDQDLSLTFSYDPPGSLDELFGIDEERLLHAFDRALARIGVTESVEVSVLITDDAGIQQLNREYRGKDEPTDVLSFPLLDHPLVEAPADQLWQPGDDDLDDLDELDDGDEGDAAPAADAADEMAPDGDGLKGMIVLMGDDDDDNDDDGLEDDWDDEPEVWPTHLGDIAISRETALRQAQQAGHSPAFELAFLFVHGVLHLVGFDDHTDAGYQAMVAHQEAALAQAGVTR